MGSTSPRSVKTSEAAVPSSRVDIASSVSCDARLTSSSRSLFLSQGARNADLPFSFPQSLDQRSFDKRKHKLALHLDMVQVKVGDVHQQRLPLQSSFGDLAVDFSSFPRGRVAV